ncbi:MAG: protein kinase [Chloroflexaceae bacterium]|nr:protein kinase [Chloroflexaceae bacterium]NJO05223.1 protein kinase [Chloroflexaceae bacterium]
MQQTILNGRYRLVEKIGEGGMAAVYLGHDLRLNRQVAIKMLHQHFVNDADFLNRFQHEAQAAANLNHPYVVNVYDVGQDETCHYIVMEYVNGENLKTIINRDAPLPVNYAVAIAEAVAYGLDGAHRISLIHRDIKPQNIMVTRDGHVRITDFGIAKSHLSTALTETGITFGTADYISPEQARGQTAIPQSDIYALGVTLYEMLTGRLPYTGDSAISVAMQHVSADPPPIRKLNPLVPPQLEALVMQAMAKDPTQRPTSARAFAQQLHQYRGFAEQQTVLAPAPVAYETDSLPVRPPYTAQPSQSTTSILYRGSIPPRRSVLSRPPNQGQGCGLAVIGTLLLSGVLGVVLLLSMPAFSLDYQTAGQRNTTTVVEAESPSFTPLPSTLDASPTPTATPVPSVLPTPPPTPTPDNLTTVPDIRNLSEVEAQAILLNAELVPIIGEQAHNEQVEAGRIINQHVLPGTRLERGSVITYSLSLGPRLVEVPNLVNMRLEQVLALLANVGFQYQLDFQPHAQVSRDFVIRQEPNAGARVEPGTPIFLEISLGDVVRFPDVVGMPREQAEQLILRSGLSLEYVDQQGRDKLGEAFDLLPPGQVVSAMANGQSVRNGDYIQPGSRIVLGVRATE